MCEVRPQKSNPNYTRIAIGGNRICYHGDAGTPTGSLELFKLIINSVLSLINAKLSCFGVSNFYLATPMDWSEYVQIQLADIPQ